MIDSIVSWNYFDCTEQVSRKLFVVVVDDTWLSVDVEQPFVLTFEQQQQQHLSLSMRMMVVVMVDWRSVLNVDYSEWYLSHVESNFFVDPMA